MNPIRILSSNFGQTVRWFLPFARSSIPSLHLFIWQIVSDSESNTRMPLKPGLFNTARLVILQGFTTFCCWKVELTFLSCDALVLLIFSRSWPKTLSPFFSSILLSISIMNPLAMWNNCHSWEVTSNPDIRCLSMMAAFIKSWFECMYESWPVSWARTTTWSWQEMDKRRSMLWVTFQRNVTDSWRRSQRPSLSANTWMVISKKKTVYQKVSTLCVGVDYQVVTSKKQRSSSRFDQLCFVCVYVYFALCAPRQLCELGTLTLLTVKYYSLELQLSVSWQWKIFTLDLVFGCTWVTYSFSDTAEPISLHQAV